MVSIGETIMPEIMANSSYEKSHLIDVIKFSKLSEAPLCQKGMCHVSNIDAMQIVMVLYVLPVGVLNLAEEL